MPVEVLVFSSYLVMNYLYLTQWPAQLTLEAPWPRAAVLIALCCLRCVSEGPTPRQALKPGNLCFSPATSGILVSVLIRACFRIPSSRVSDGRQYVPKKLCVYFNRK